MSFFEIVEWICAAGMVVGYVLYVIGLGNLGTILKDRDSEAIGRVRIGAVILIAASILSVFIPSWIVWIAELVAYIMMFMGFNVLKKSTAIDAKAARGFSQLFMAIVFILITIGLNLTLGWIPIIGWGVDVVVWILEVVAFIMIITGWRTVKNSPAK